MIALKILGLADGRATIHDGQYLVDSAHEGLVADLLTSPSLEQAKKFPTVLDALEYWFEDNPDLPIRPDGEPNKPRSAYNIQTINVPQD